jgi:hypothetical protein
MLRAPPDHLQWLELLLTRHERCGYGRPADATGSSGRRERGAGVGQGLSGGGGGSCYSALAAPSSAGTATTELAEGQRS